LLFMHEPGRLDLSAIKGRLQVALKEKAGAYWEYLRKFVQLKLSKREFEYYARSLLGEDNIWIHNVFIRSIISNARCPYPPVIPQSPARPAKKKQILVPIKEPLTLSPQNNTPQLANKKPTPKKKKTTNAPSAPTSTAQQPQPTRVPAPPKPTARTKQVASKKPHPSPLKEGPLTADHAVLRQKMQRIVTDAGLSGLTHDSIRLMMLAVEAYVKRIIHSSKPVYRPHPPKPDHTKPPVPPYNDGWYNHNPSSSTSSLSLPAPTPSSSSSSSHQPAITPSVNGTLLPKVSTLTLQDLYETGYLHPSILGEDFVVEQERMSFALM